MLSAARWYLICFAAVFPLFALPFTEDFYGFNKWVLLLVTAVFLTILWSLIALKKRALAVGRGAGLAGFAVLTVSSVLSTLVVSADTAESAAAPFGPLTLVAATAVLALAPAFLTEQSRTLLRWALYLAAAVSGIIAVYGAIGLGRMVFPAVPALTNPLFTPAGSSLALITLLIVILPAIAAETLAQIRKRDWARTGFLALGTAIIAAGLALTAAGIIPHIPATVLPAADGWSILMDSYKGAEHLLLGVGPGNYLSAFTAGRPVSLNLTPLWNTRFTSANSFLFHIGTTTGIPGIAGVLILVWASVRPLFSRRKRSLTETGLAAALAAAGLSLLILPPSIIQIVLLAELLLLSGDRGEAEPPAVRMPALSRHAAAGAAGAVVLLSAGLLFLLGRYYAGETLYYRALRAADAKNVKTYNYLLRAIEMSPFRTQYHLSFSRLNLLLAQNLLSADQKNAGTASPGASFTDAEKKTLTTLTQQAIREGKVATSLEPRWVTAWENLGALYDTLSAYTDGAEQWSIASYEKAITLDPANPRLRLTLGGIYTRQGNNDAAVSQFLAAVNLKPDYANAYYNLAYAYEQKKDYLRAAIALRETVAHVGKDTADAKTAGGLLAGVTAKLSPGEKTALAAMASATAAGTRGGVNPLDILTRPTGYPELVVPASPAPAPPH